MSTTSSEHHKADSIESLAFGVDRLPAQALPAEQDPIYSLFADQELYQDLIEHFVIGLHLEIRAIDDAISEDKPRLIAHIAHKIRGTAATFGYPSFAAVCETVESTVQNPPSASLTASDVQGLRTLVGTLCSLHKRMLAALTRR
jgi:HPt (histidine-containing phosphotransfer) domain-containing protein